MDRLSSTRRPLEDAIREKKSEVAVIGLGFVGLTEAVALAEAGFTVLGLDVDKGVVAGIQAGGSPNGHIPPSRIAPLVHSGALRASADFALLAEADVAVICVPTPVKDGSVDLDAVRSTAAAIARTLDRPKLILLESTVPPGTTRNVVRTLLDGGHRTPGRDFFLAACPERIDLLNSTYTLANTPRVVGGLTPEDTRLAQLFYASFVQHVHAVPTPEVAEAAKVFENVFRFVNIGLVNEFALLCRSLHIDPWATIDAAATKPFGFLKHLPGPGVGGACIPWAPYYLLGAAQGFEAPRGFLEASLAINAMMPEHIALRAAQLAGGSGRHILIVGVTYKPGVADIRESPALPVMERLHAWGFRLSYLDPFVPTLSLDGLQLRSLPTTSPLESIDCAVVITAHAEIDYQALCSAVPVIFDTRNALAGLGRQNVIPL